MITHRNLNEVVNELPENEKQRIIDSSKEYCVLFLHIFNTGFVVDCTLTDNYNRYKNVGNNGNAILETKDIAEIIELQNEKNKIKNQIPENINLLFRHLDGKANRTAIFRHYRNNSESHKYPIFNRFSAEERAINRLYNFEKQSGEYLTGLELCLFIDNQLSIIVNAE